jgi:DNA (cytosine-5)-methyltransferase 1
MMRYGSICSGIEAATAAWSGLGWQPAFFSEIDAFPRALLKHRYPDVPLHGDFTTIGSDEYGAVDLIVGGTPCQDFSVAGLRAGMGGARGALTLEFLRLLDRKRPRWVVWENVPGVFSSDGGRAFGAFLGGLALLGYGWAYRVLDAQYFGVPQRRRRVFVVGCFGDERRAAAVLFERACLSGHPTPRRQAGAIASALTRNGVGGGGGPDDNAAQANHLIASTLAAYASRNQIEQTYVAHSLRADGFDASEDGTGRGTPLVPVAFSMRTRDGEPQAEAPEVVSSLRGSNGGSSREFVAFSCKDHGADAGNVAPTLPAMHNSASHANGGGQIAVAFQSSQSGVREVDARATLDANNGSRRMNGVVASSGVRRLTPRECERLQGFCDDYTLVPYRGKPAADGPRYRALGNSMAVPVVRWIGERIAMVAA